MTAETSNARGEWVLVPREPTEAMQTAHRMYGDTSDWWNAIIAAAPPSAARGDVRADLAALAREYRPSMSADVLHAWAADVVAALAAEGVQAEPKPEARGAVDVEAIRRACQSGKRFWQAGPGYYEEIESLLPALTEARNVR